MKSASPPETARSRIVLNRFKCVFEIEDTHTECRFNGM
jgi:hypothetical protein